MKIDTNVKTNVKAGGLGSINHNATRLVVKSGLKAGKTFVANQ